MKGYGPPVGERVKAGQARWARLGKRRKARGRGGLGKCFVFSNCFPFCLKTCFEPSFENRPKLAKFNFENI
jgi:hypothetical protein